MKRYLIFLLLLPVMLFAGDYSLDQMILHGLKHSYQVQSNEQSAEISASSFRSSKWNLLPEAGVNAGLSRDLAHVGSGSATSSTAGFSIAKSISLNDASYFAYRQAKLDQSRVNLKLEASYQDYAYQVFEAYLEVLSATKRKSALQENMAIQNRVLEQSQTLQRLGKSTPFDVKQNEIAVMNSQISIIQLENTIANVRARLFALVRMDDNGGELSDLEIDLNKEIPAYNADGINDLLLLKQDMKKSELSMQQTTLGLFPTLSLSYNFSRRVYGSDFDFDKYNTSHGIGLNLSYSLWNPFTSGESRLRTKIGQEMEKLSYLDKEEQKKREYDSSTQELEYLLRLNELYFERLQQSTAQVQIAEERYRLGMIQLLDLDKSRTDYIAADIEYNTNRYQIISKQEAIHYLLSQKILGKW